jgi:hypothetical protein
VDDLKTDILYRQHIQGDPPSWREARRRRDHAAYELLEQLGISFFYGDIVPPPVATLAVPALNLRNLVCRRGFLLQSGGMINLMVFSFEDYVKLLDQMAKMKANYLQFWWFLRAVAQVFLQGRAQQLGDAQGGGSFPGRTSVPGRTRRVSSRSGER